MRMLDNSHLEVVPLAGPHTQPGAEVAVGDRVGGQRVLASLSLLSGQLGQQRRI